MGSGTTWIKQCGFNLTEFQKIKIETVLIN